MNAKLLGFFSGFPTHHFTDEIAGVLKQELHSRSSLVFISAWPEDDAKNDEDAEGMHGMFAERGMAFGRHDVIDHRKSPEEAGKLVSAADCLFLMGGNATKQMRMIREMDLADKIRNSKAVILGVSAGAINMGKKSLDIWESTIPYDGLGLADITIKSHYAEGEEFVEKLKEASEKILICAMEDESAIFLKGGTMWQMGRIHLVNKGRITPIITDGRQTEYRRVFDTIPDQFDKFRPRYSADLFRHLIAEAKIGPEKSVLEIGPGTGQATDPILDTGCDYHAIELGEHLYVKMKEKYGDRPNFHIVNDDFITHDFGGQKFDMIYSAATIQWIPERVAFPKTLELLKPGGVLAMMFLIGDYRTPNEKLYQSIQKVYDEYYRPVTMYKDMKEPFDYSHATDYGYMDLVRRDFYGKRVFDADEYVLYCGTHCDHMMIREPYKTKFFEGLRNAVLEGGNKVEFRDTYVLYMAKKP